MSDSSAMYFDADLRLLFTRLCANDLTEADAKSLAARLESEPTTRECYVRYMSLHAELWWQYAGTTEEFSAEDAHPTSDAAKDIHSKKRWPPLMLHSLAKLMPWTAISRSSVLVWSAAVVTNLIMVFVLALLVSPPLREQVTKSWSVIVGRSASTPQEAAVARLTRTRDCRWQDTQSSPKEGESLAPQTLRLAAGLAEIQFNSKARVIIEGPCEFDVQSVAQGYLRAGKLVARVTKGAQGFAIETETARIVDLGTEFGVFARESGKTDVEVMKGRVLIEPPSTKNHSFPAAVLNTGDVKRIERMASGQSIVSDVADSSRIAFKQSLTKQVFSPSLIAYWNLKDGESFRMAGGQVEDSHDRNKSRHVPQLINTETAPFEQTGTEYKAVDPLEFALTNGLSVEVTFSSSWLGKSGDYDYLFRKEVHGKTSILFTLTNDPRQIAAGPALVFSVLTDRVGVQTLAVALDGKQGRPTISQIANGKRHHLVAIYDGGFGEMAIYLDQKRRASQRIPTGTLLQPNREQSSTDSMVIGDTKDPFNGTLDEVAMYRAAIESSEIARHWEKVKAGRGYFESTEP